jgi:hypothetical protein
MIARLRRTIRGFLAPFQGAAKKRAFCRSIPVAVDRFAVLATG